MKKLLTALVLTTTITTAQATPTMRPMPNYHEYMAQRAYHTAHRANRRANDAIAIASVAVVVAVVATVVAINASDNTPGHVQIARF